MNGKPTLADAIKEAVSEPDTFRRRELLEGVILFMRFRMGWTAAQCTQAAIKSGVSPETWEEMLYEADRAP